MSMIRVSPCALYCRGRHRHLRISPDSKTLTTWSLRQHNECDKGNCCMSPGSFRAGNTKGCRAVCHRPGFTNTHLFYQHFRKRTSTEIITATSAMLYATKKVLNIVKALNTKIREFLSIRCVALKCTKWIKKKNKISILFIENDISSQIPISLFYSWFRF